MGGAGHVAGDVSGVYCSGDLDVDRSWDWVQLAHGGDQ